MKNYGLILADNGSNWYFQGVADTRWTYNDVDQLKQIPASAFQAVDESCLTVSPNSGQALQPGTSGLQPRAATLPKPSHRKATTSPVRTVGCSSSRPDSPRVIFGSLPGLGVRVDNIVGIVPTDNFTGYDLVGSDGGVFVFPTGQSSGYFGSLPGLGVRVDNIVGIVPTDNFTGYDLVGSDGGVFVFPTGQSSRLLRIVAGSRGQGRQHRRHRRESRRSVATFSSGETAASSPSGTHHSSALCPGSASMSMTSRAFPPPPTDRATTWSDRTDPCIHSVTPGPSDRCRQSGVSVSDIVGIVPNPDSKGYWLVGADGGVFAFGDAPNLGSLPGVGVNVDDVVGAVPTG